jgi:hypothetical protein
LCLYFRYQLTSAIGGVRLYVLQAREVLALNHHRLTASLALILFGMVCLGQSCGTRLGAGMQLAGSSLERNSTATAPGMAGGQPAAQAPLAVLQLSGGFTVRVLPDSLLDGGAVERFTAEIAQQPGASELELSLHVTGARGLKALFLELAYDGACWRQAAATIAPPFGAAADALCLCHSAGAGTADAGVVLRNWDSQPGFTGDGAILSIRFSSGVEPERTPSAPPAAANSQARLVWDAGTSQLCWYYTNCGDYNQNGVVGLTDLVPLAQYIGETGPATGYPETTERSVIDGNGDHRISTADLAPIGANWGASVLGGYNIYGSASRDDYPAAGVAPPDAWLTRGHVDFSGATCGAHERKRFTSVIQAPNPAEYFWVRPSDGDLDGTPSSLAQQTPSAPGGWNMQMHDAQRTCRSEYTGPATPTLKWAYSPPGDTGHFAQPVVDAAGTIYCCESSDLLAIQPTGAESWRASIAAPSIPAVASDGSIITLAEGAGCICALNADGSTRWLSDSYTALHPPAVCPDGTVLAASQTKVFRVLNSDGTLKWSFDTAWNAVGRAAYGPDGTIYLLCANILYALSPAGAELWEKDILWTATKVPVVGAEGMIYIINDYSLIALYPDGIAKYQYKDAGGMVANYGPAAGADGTVYFASSAGNIYAVSHTGSLVWKYACGAAVQAAPVVAADGTVYVGTTAGVVHAIAPDGAARWTYTTAGEIATSPVCAPGGSVYVVNVAGLFYALDRAGKLLWSFGDHPGADSGIVLAADNTSYFTSAGRLMAVDALGRPKWAVTDATDSFALTPAINSSGQVIAPCGRSIYILNPDGTTSLKAGAPGSSPQTTGYCMDAPLVQPDGKLLFFTSGYIHKLAGMGEIIWSHLVDETGSFNWNCSCGGSNGAVYYACGNTYDQKKSAIHALDSSGALQWTYYKDASDLYRMACGSDGVVYLLDRNGSVFFIDAAGNPLGGYRAIRAA